MATPNKKTITDVITVVQHGEQLVIPESLPLDRAVKVLQQKIEFEGQDVAVNAVIPGFVYDGAHAFYRVLEAKFGWANSVATPTMFGPRPPAILSVPVDIDKVVEVPWGRFELPGIEGYLDTGVDFQDGQWVFVIGGVVKRKHEKQIAEIVETTKAYLKEHSVYRGKPFQVRWRDEEGDPLEMPQPQFLDLPGDTRSNLIFSDDVRASIETNLFTIIENTDQVRKIGVPLKRGILLSGPYGTGKSMTSAATAELAVANGWTFINCLRAQELGDILRLARQYQPCVVFCEDIDRALDGKRSVDMDDILNIVDGVESKNTEILVVLTTNNVERIHQAMLRPGRLDAVIHVAPPDAAAAERLMRHYGNGLIPADEDIAEAARLMEGQIPAVLREVVERSKLAALRLQRESGTSGALVITKDALIDASLSMNNQLELLKPVENDTRSEQVKSAQIMADALERNGAGYTALATHIQSLVNGQPKPDADPAEPKTIGFHAK
jgi:transitional endoplasmic reticulum ATPase